MSENFWTASGGRKIKYKDLEDDHLKNIIKDGYRNPHILVEAERRGFDVPKRPVDDLTFSEQMMWVESFASTALSGNKFAEDMIDLYRTRPAEFDLYLNQLLNKIQEDKSE